MADTMQTKVGFGAKADLTAAITSGKIDSGDIVFTSDTHETAFIDENNTPIFMKSKSTKEYTLNGTSLGALDSGKKFQLELIWMDF